MGCDASLRGLGQLFGEGCEGTPFLLPRNAASVEGWPSGPFGVEIPGMVEGLTARVNLHLGNLEQPTNSPEGPRLATSGNLQEGHRVVMFETIRGEPVSEILAQTVVLKHTSLWKV